VVVDASNGVGSYASPGISYEFRSGASCFLCGGDERVVLVRSGAELPGVGVCEACSVHVRCAWREAPGDAPPAQGVARVTRVKALVLRLAELGEAARSEGLEADPTCASSYEVAMVVGSGGELDLPSQDVSAEDSELSAVLRSLAACGISTWEPLVEPLYAAHTARGRVARVYLVRAWHSPSDLVQWRPWPPWEHAPSSGALYLALRDVMRYRAPSLKPLSALSVRVREAAHRYVQIQRSLRAKVCGVDSSMLPLLRQSMSEDEKVVDRLVREHDEVEADVLRQEVAEEAEVEDGGAAEVPDDVAVGDLPEAASAEEDDDDVRF